MTVRVASCSCGQLQIACEGEPVRVSICHCLECQKRTGSVFASQARYPRERVTVKGRATHWARSGDSGGPPATFSFCPICGSTVFWEPAGASLILVAVGAFADPAFPPPQVSVYDNRQHPWVLAIQDLPMEHWS